MCCRLSTGEIWRKRADTMCESSVYILKGADKKLVMPEAARVMSS